MHEATMRILNILCGLAVLFTTLAFTHLLHHHFLGASHEDVHNPASLAGMAVLVVVGVLSFIGGCLLLRRGR
jgi:hypothetical protein